MINCQVCLWISSYSVYTYMLWHNKLKNSVAQWLSSRIYNRCTVSRGFKFHQLSRIFSEHETQQSLYITGWLHELIRAWYDKHIYIYLYSRHHHVKDVYIWSQPGVITRKVPTTLSKHLGNSDSKSRRYIYGKSYIRRSSTWPHYV